MKKIVRTGVVAKAGGFQADIRVLGGGNVTVVKAAAEEGLFSCKIVAAFTELARRKGILSDGEAFWLELADSNAGTWHLAKGKEEAFEGIFDELEVEDAFWVSEEDVQQASEIIATVKVPDDDAAASEWQEFIEILGEAVFG